MTDKIDDGGLAASYREPIPGWSGAAKQASLCDLVEPARKLRAEVKRLTTILNEIAAPFGPAAKGFGSAEEWCNIAQRLQRKARDTLQALI